MKVLMLSEDRNILRPGSEPALRMEEYANVLGELHVVVPGGGEESRNGNLYIYSVPWRSLGVLRKGWKLCRAVKFDVLTVQATDDIGLVGFFLSRWFKISFQLQLHTDVMSPWYRKGSVKEWVKYWIAKFLIPHASGVRAVSERIKKSISNTLVFVLPIFTDLTKYFDSKRNPEVDQKFNSYEFKMIAVGRFVEKEKNFLMLISLMCEFVKVCPKALLVIVGEGPDKKRYEQRIQECDLGESIMLEPWREDLPTFYKSFDLFLLSSNYEGWGRVVLEAMASGLPVVMTDVGLAGEVVKNNENGRMTPVGDMQAMLEVVIDLYKNPEKRKKFVETGLITVKSIRPSNKEEYLKKYRESFKFYRQ